MSFPLKKEDNYVDKIEPGLAGEATTTVTDVVTARHLGSGRVNAFATPAMIALMEMAAVNAIDHLLPEGQISVGTTLEVNHLAPTPVGQKIRARAEVFNVDGREVILTVQAWDETEMIGEGMHTRVVVDVARFKERLASKTQQSGNR